MNTFRTWFTPGSLVLAVLVALLWLHQMHWALVLCELVQVGLVCLTYLGLWVLTRDHTPRR